MPFKPPYIHSDSTQTLYQSTISRIPFASSSCHDARPHSLGTSYGPHKYRNSSSSQSSSKFGPPISPKLHFTLSWRIACSSIRRFPCTLATVAQARQELWSVSFLLSSYSRSLAQENWYVQALQQWKPDTLTHARLVTSFRRNQSYSRTDTDQMPCPTTSILFKACLQAMGMLLLDLIGTLRTEEKPSHGQFAFLLSR